ncbi:ATPase [uncultured Parabacteroides sp.]|jgi:N-acetylglucosamine kinase-like BadF-type ATPase|uniref:ATPase n=1 Tax=uncultured Parabacteroides sp. TaxID=512312 RepID=UPI002591D29E|nr:ATPase [uncultured Parabacteroides sp.]
MILIADSGSTKTDWCVVENGESILRFKTRGTNPFFQTEEEIGKEIEAGLLPSLKGFEPSAIYFYGAGCAFPEKNDMIRRAVNRYLSVPVEVGSDLLAAARALCGDQPGIACIMGTGSNSCYYDGREIVKNVSPLGFILGDEGSGAVLGKLLIGDVLKDQLPPALKDQFLTQYELTPALIMDKVYRQPFPNRFLAGFSPFIREHLDEPAIWELVTRSFLAFFTRNVKQYDYFEQPVHLVGSVAWYYQDVLKEIAFDLGIRLGTVARSPMEGLIAYHGQPML